jgi:3-phenylpropionate/trans-cinnamate dioxygenase ferredoxin reductase subunit
VDQTILIAGAGHAGGSAAAMLRQLGWQGPITLIGEGPVLPYQRPPLSKAWLTGDETAESVALRPGGFYTAAGIGLRLGTRLIGIDRAARTVALPDGEVLAYDILILALGARPRRLTVPGAALELRSIADADRLKAALWPGARLAIIGGGFIGLEVAASACSAGTHVTIIEREDRVLARVACSLLSDFFHSRHQARGVRIITGAEVAAFEGTGGDLAGVRLRDGRLIACDSVLAATGVVPNDEIARAAGLKCEDGIIVDLAARTNDPAIFAIGDCTRRPLSLYARMGRLESVPNALEQAKQAAGLICSKPPPAPEVPWFWSDQYDLRLQMAGLPLDVAQIAIRGDIGAAKFALFHLTADGTVQAVEAVNAATEFLGGRRIILKRKRLARAHIEDMSVSMQELAA